MQVLNIDEIKKEYSFLFEDKENKKEIYFCNCGAITEIKNEIKEKDCEQEQLNYLYPKNNSKINPFIDEEDGYADLFKSIRLSENDSDVKCYSCNKNFATMGNQKNLIANNSFFVSGYNVIEKEDDLFLYYGKLKSNIEKNKKGYILNFEEKQKYIRYNPGTNKIYFKDYDADEEEFDLDKIIKITDNIFEEEVKNIYNLYHVQLYISKLAKYVIDVNNTNVIEELLGEIRNRFNHAGLDSIKKVVSIFFGIIKYSSLSTIALTKGCKFLYDLMKECDIPNSIKMEENNLTSPIPIFNFLVSNYIKKINEEVNEDNKEIHEFIFKSSQMIKMEIDESDKAQEAKDFKIIDTGEVKELKIKYKENKDYKTKISHDSGANKFKVMEISSDANASKFIYKTIKDFSEYKQLLKYFKFYDKHQIITLLQKYNLELLIRVIDLIYFRDFIDIKEFERIITIINDYVINETLKYKPTLDMEKFIPDYSNVNKFEFVIYDDSIMMMEVLKFDPRKEFNKIKTFRELIDYHDNLVKYFNVVSDKEKNFKFKQFVDRFKFLESREDYDGPLEFILISTPAMLIKEGIVMKHSASSYSRKVIAETYLMGQIFDRSLNIPEDEFYRFTIGFSFDNINGLEFHQVKAFANKPGSDRFKKLLMEFLTVKDISYRPISDLKLKNE